LTAESSGERSARSAAARGTPGVALVTGGTGGIGTEVCKRLSNDGNRVVATYIPAEEELAREWREARRDEGYDLEIVACDVTSFESCAAMARHVGHRMGPVTVLVNAAGITRDKTLAKMDPGQWHAVLATNLHGVFNVTRNVIEGMRERRFGRIISISSVNGETGQFGQTNYAAAKAGILGFTRALAREVAQRGITVNAVAPGYVDTAMVHAMPEHALAEVMSQIPVGRLARAEEIARVVAFLAHEESGYITGATLDVNGGIYMA
jgi:acetoacetyl-CoA reductase